MELIMFTIFAVFIINERTYLVNKNTTMGILFEEEILIQAVQNLNNQAGFADLATVKTTGANLDDCNHCKINDAIISINGLDFICEIKRNVTNANFNNVLAACLRVKQINSKPFLLVTQYLYPALIKAFAEHNINVLDRNGNCCIKENPIFLCIRGEKSAPVKEKIGRAFQEAGLKLIFYFLTNKESVNLPYRSISQATNLSLGTIKAVIESLINENYILVTQKGRFLKNQKELLENWVTGYNQTLKPKRLLGRLSFITNEKREQWMNMQLPEGMVWGGECAANLKDGFLIPGSYQIYSKVPITALLRTGYVMPKEDGEISVYELFWDNSQNKTIPELIIYADLMGSGNSRCLEAAQRIYNDENTNIK